MGTVHSPAVKLSTLDPWLSSESRQEPMKSTSISSTTGRSPPMAAPTAAPMKAASLIGAASTRPGPKRAKRGARKV